MKHLSLWLTVLLLGALPLTAAALDYGPNHPLLAAENGAPPLPGVQARAASRGAMPKPDVAEASDETAADVSPTTPRTTPAPPPSPVVAPPEHGQSASNKPRHGASGPATAASPASWQSLLPGSIQ